MRVDREKYMAIMRLVSSTEQAMEVLKALKDDVRRIANYGPNGSDEDAMVCRFCAIWCEILLIGK